jgi:MoaA/NifB/PqqE/SkfB family radical SAM enzyme
MTEAQVLQAVDFISGQGAKAVVMSGGGEPSISKHFTAAVEAIHNEGMDIGIVTNGVSWDIEKMIHVLDRATWVRVSLDAVDPIQYRDIRGTIHYDRVVGNISQLLALRTARESKTTIGVQAVITRKNAHTIPQFIDMCLSNFPGIDYVQIRPDEKFASEFSPSELRDVSSVLSCAVSEKVFVSDKWDLVFEPTVEHGFGACHCNEFIGVVDAYGNYYTCCHVIGLDHYKRQNIFDINDMTTKSPAELSETRGFNADVCPVGCRGSGTNRLLEGFSSPPKHGNFL